MALNAIFRATCNWMDISTAANVHRWLFTICDSAQGCLWTPAGDTAEGTAAVLRSMASLWDQGGVMRLNNARLAVPHAELLGSEPRGVLVLPSLTRVGRTSWQCSFRITEDTAEARLLAEVETIMVATNADHTKSVELPNAGALRELAVAPLGLAKPEFNPPSPRLLAGGGSFSCSWTTRVTDCDSLGHVNNAVWASLAEEVRATALRAGGYCDAGAALAALPATSMAISYIDQARPFVEMHAVTFWDEATSVFRIDFFSEGMAGAARKLVGEVTIGVLVEARTASL